MVYVSLLLDFKGKRTYSLIPLIYVSVRTSRTIFLQNLVVMTGAMGILTKEAEPTKFSSSAAVFAMEAIKFLLAVGGLVRSRGGTKSSFVFEAKDTVMLGLVAALYGVWNNLRFYILEIIDPATLFLIHNVKIVFTAIFLRIFVGKTLKPKQWISLLVLTLGVAVVMIHRDESDEKESSSTTTSSKSLVLFGCILALVRGIGTALTNVLCEYVFKRQKEGFWYVNAELYLFGMIVNFISLLSTEDDSSSNIFHDMFTILPILIVLLGGFSGICVSFIFKFIDNIALIAADVLAMVILVFISAAYFGLSITAPLIVGCFLIIASLGYYYTNGEDDETESSSSSSSATVIEIPMTPPTKAEVDQS